MNETESHTAARPTLRLAALSALSVIAVWVGGSRLGVPLLLRALHGADGLPVGPVADRFLTSRSRIPVESYLSDWSEQLPRLDYTILTAVLLALLAVATWTFLRRPTPADTAQEDRGPAAEIASWAAVGALFGAVTSIGEAYHLFARLFYVRVPLSRYFIAGPESVWMVIPVDIILFGIIGVLWGVVGRFAPFRAHRTVGVGLLAALGLLTWLSAPAPIHFAGAVLLSLGLAVRMADPLARRWRALTLWAGRIAIPVAIAAALMAAIQLSSQEARAHHRVTPGTERPQGPNILLVVLDTERAQSWGPSADGPSITPRVEAWAAGGVTFERAIAPANWTLPSHASLFTGAPPWETGVDFAVPLKPSYVTLAEYFGSQGYRTGAFIGNIHFLGSPFGLAQGFELYDDHPRTLRYALLSSRLVRRSWFLFLRTTTRAPYPVEKEAAAVTDPFLTWLDRETNTPFFAFLNYFDAHEPYRPPGEFRSRSSPGDPAHFFRGDRSEAYSEVEINGLRNAYHDEMTYLDDHVDRLLGSLEDRGVLDNTVVMITSDHGEEFGEHGRLDHINGIYRTLIHVPLIALGPGIPRGIRVNHPVSLSALPATLATLAGYERHPFPRRPLATRLGITETLEPVFSGFGERFSIVEGTLHYIRSREAAEQLFDWSGDPWEQVDLARFDSCRAELGRFRDLLEDAVPAARILPDLRGQAGASSDDEALPCASVNAP